MKHQHTLTTWSVMKELSMYQSIELICNAKHSVQKLVYEI